jgi:hypothetical protein
LTTALGSWLIIPLIYIVNSGGEDDAWVAENIDEGNLEYYFFLLAALMLFCLVSTSSSSCCCHLFFFNTAMLA